MFAGLVSRKGNLLNYKNTEKLNNNNKKHRASFLILNSIDGCHLYSLKTWDTHPKCRY